MNGNKQTKNNFYRYNNPKYSEKKESLTASYHSVENDIQNGCYATARKKLLLLKKTQQHNIIWKMQSEIEALEYNYNKAFNLLEKCEQLNNMRNKSIYEYKFRLALIYFRQGQFTLARALFTELLNTPHHHQLALRHLIYIDLLTNHYERAYKKIPLLDANNYYNDILYMLLYQDLDNTPQYLIKRNPYFYKRLNDDSNKLLIQHIKQVCSNSIKNYQREFIAEIELYELISYIKYNLDNYNPTYLNTYKRYIMTFDDIIGYINGEATKSIGVNILGLEHRIIDIYPIQISKQFDKEHNCLKKTL